MSVIPPTVKISCGRCGTSWYTDPLTNTPKPACACIDHSGCPAPLKEETKPFKCPVCGGTGSVPWHFYNGEFGMWGTGNISSNVSCRSCEGKGIVWRTENEN
jgi:hypothetical protein